MQQVHCRSSVNGADAKYIGKMKFEDAGLKVIFTQCYYKYK